MRVSSFASSSRCWGWLPFPSWARTLGQAGACTRRPAPIATERKAKGWVNLASSISPNAVKQLRAEAENRKGLPWTLAELEAAEKTGAGSEPPDR